MGTTIKDILLFHVSIDFFTKSVRYFSNHNFQSINHPIVHKNIPATTYAIVILIPKIHKNKAIATSFTSGDVIKNDKVTHSGIPALRNHTNNGIEEQLQNGVIVPNIDANK